MRSITIILSLFCCTKFSFAQQPSPIKNYYVHYKSCMVFKNLDDDICIQLFDDSTFLFEQYSYDSFNDTITKSSVKGVWLMKNNELELLKKNFQEERKPECNILLPANKTDSVYIKELFSLSFVVKDSAICLKNYNNYCLDSFLQKDILFLRTSFAKGDISAIKNKYLYGFPLPKR